MCSVNEKRIKMLSKLISFFKPPEFENFEFTQKARFLHTTLLVITVACIFLGIQNMTGETYLDDFLFILSGISFLGILFNKHGYYRPTAFFVAALMLGLITFSLIDGVGLKDAGLIDCFAKKGVEQRNTIKSVFPKRTVDYIWVNKKLEDRLLRCKVLFEGNFRTNPMDARSIALSDHLPVMAEFR